MISSASQFAFCLVLLPLDVEAMVDSTVQSVSFLLGVVVNG